MVDYKEILKAIDYDFINNNEHLGKHVILLGLAGSYSYGTGCGCTPAPFTSDGNADHWERCGQFDQDIF